MYHKRDRTCAFIAFAYWIAWMAGLLCIGILLQKQVKHYNLIYYFLFIAGILTVLFKDRSLGALGFSREKLRTNLTVSGAIVLVTFGISLFFSELPLSKLVELTLYYLLYIALVEETMFRGLLQNYLFGLNGSRCALFCLGGIMFSLMHLPFQMYKAGDVSFHYVLTALPQLGYTFLFHLLMCFITAKQKDVLIPIALHYANNYIQEVM